MAVKRCLAAFSSLALSGTAMACATCSGPADAAQTQGMNAAILTLFGVLCVLGLSAAGFVGVIARRIARHEKTVSMTTEASTMPPLAIRES
jgi:hypothetical protein